MTGELPASRHVSKLLDSGVSKTAHNRVQKLCHSRGLRLAFHSPLAVIAA